MGGRDGMFGCKAGAWVKVLLPAACAVLSLTVAALVVAGVAEDRLGEWWVAFGAYAFAGGLFVGLSFGGLPLGRRRRAGSGDALPRGTVRDPETRAAAESLAERGRRVLGG